MKTFLTAILLFTTFYGVFAQQQISVSGKITDGDGKPVAFASVYIKNTTKGTSANSEGDYSLALKPGNYEVLFKAVGYRQESRKLQLTASRHVDISLTAETYQLNTVTIGAGDEDPAYAIMRKAIKKRRTYADEVKAYTCEVYIKGLQKLLAAPKKFMGRDINQIGREIGLDSNRRGIIYLSESASKYSYQSPGHVHEEMISSKVSGSNQAFSFNRASDLSVDFYQSQLNWGDISYRPLISPVAESAMFYYRYKWMGISVENGETINKIQVIPKRNYDPCFEGYIYIIEDSWRIYSINLMITKRSNIRFADTIHVNQQFFPVAANKWMPANTKFEFTGGLFGFRLGGYFVAVYKNYDLQPTFTRNEFSEVLRITRQVNKRDSNYWEKERPVPLTLEEKTDYSKKDILSKKRESKSYLDSLDKVNNKLSAGKLFLNGYTVRNRATQQSWHFNPLLSSINFNTVEGFALNYGVTYTKRLDTSSNDLGDFGNRYLRLSGNIKYGFSDHLLNGYAAASIPVHEVTIDLTGGSDVVDLNNQSPISPFLNTFHSLLQRRNYEKLYERQFLYAGISKRIYGGWKATFNAEWANRKWLPNSSSFSILHPADREYTSNNPYTPLQDIPLFPENKAFKIRFRTTYDFSNEYETYPSGRHYLPSAYPTIGFTFVKGIKNILGSDVDYDRLSVDLSKQDIAMGMFGKTSFYLEAGKFIDAKSVFYPDYKQFEGLEGTFYRPMINRFLLLDYYRFGTYTQYAEAHVEHNFSGFIINKLPVIRKLKLQEIVDFNYLTTPALKNYTELGLGLQYLNIRLMYGRSFNSGGNITSALRLGIYL